MLDLNHLINSLQVGMLGASSAVAGYSALDKLLEVANTKAIALQTQLATAPELTEHAYKLAKEAAERLSSGDFHSGLLCAAAAGFAGGVVIYVACGRNK